MADQSNNDSEQKFNPPATPEMQTEGNQLFGLPSLDVAGLEEFWTDLINDTSLFATGPAEEGDGQDEDVNDAIEQELLGIDGSSGEPTVTLNSLRHVYPRKPTPRARYEQRWKELRLQSLDPFVSLLNVSDVVGLRRFIDNHCDAAATLHSQQLRTTFSGHFAIFCFWNMLREVHPDGVFKVLERRVVSRESSSHNVTAAASTSKAENRRILKRSPSHSLNHLSHLNLVGGGGGSGVKGHSSNDSSLGSPMSPALHPQQQRHIAVSKSMSHSNEQIPMLDPRQLSDDNSLEYQQEQQEEHRQQLSEQFTDLEVIIRLAGTPLTNLKLGELFTRLMATSEVNIHEQQTPVKVSMYTTRFLHAIGHTMDIAEALLQLPLSTTATTATASSLSVMPLIKRGERIYILEITVRFDPQSSLIVDWNWEILAENSPPGAKTAMAAVAAASSSSSGRNRATVSHSSSSDL
jgi:hypothetical protein